MSKSKRITEPLNLGSIIPKRVRKDSSSTMMTAGFGIPFAFGEETFDSQEPTSPSIDSPPCTPTELLISNQKTPKICPPSPSKTPATIKKRIMEREQQSLMYNASSTPLDFDGDSSSSSLDEETFGRSLSLSKKKGHGKLLDTAKTPASTRKSKPRTGAVANDLLFSPGKKLFNSAPVQGTSHLSRTSSSASVATPTSDPDYDSRITPHKKGPYITTTPPSSDAISPDSSLGSIASNKEESTDDLDDVITDSPPRRNQAAPAIASPIIGSAKTPNKSSSRTAMFKSPRRLNMDTGDSERRPHSSAKSEAKTNFFFEEEEQEQEVQSSIPLSLGFSQDLGDVPMQEGEQCYSPPRPTSVGRRSGSGGSGGSFSGSFLGPHHDTIPIPITSERAHENPFSPISRAKKNHRRRSSIDNINNDSATPSASASINKNINNNNSVIAKEKELKQLQQQQAIKIDPLKSLEALVGNGGSGGSAGAGIAGSLAGHQITGKDATTILKQLGYSISRYMEDFDQINEIGSGSFGSVYRCRHKLDGMEYAIKKTKRIITGNKNKECVLREVYALAALVNNPHVVRYFNAWLEEDSTVLYVQTELCEGGTIADLWQRNPQEMATEERLKDLLLQVGRGLAQMHSMGLVHLDIKPENIYVHGDGKTYKIGDLGLIGDAAENETDYEGDSRYLSSEMLCEERKDLKKADIFALGITIYELSRPGWVPPANGPEWQNLRNGNIPPPPINISPEFFELIKAMMHPDPTKRPSADEVVSHPLLRPENNMDEAALRARVRELEQQLREQERITNELRKELDMMREDLQF